MFNYTVFIRIIVSFSCLFLFVVGCDKKAESPKKTGTIVSKKISVAEAPAKSAPVQPVKTEPQKTEEAAEGASAEAVGTTTVQPEQPKYLPDLVMGYDPKGRIDPFIPLIKKAPVNAAKEAEVNSADAEKIKERKKRIPQTPLEKIELSQLRLRAIVLAPSGNRALVEESSGKGYILTKGTYIGRNQGVVTEITKDKVLVEETVESIQGDIAIQEKELKLPKPPGEE